MNVLLTTNVAGATICWRAPYFSKEMYLDVVVAGFEIVRGKGWVTCGWFSCEADLFLFCHQSSGVSTGREENDFQGRLRINSLVVFLNGFVIRTIRQVCEAVQYPFLFAEKI